MNIAKLKKLKKWILDEPRRYNQNTWVATEGPRVANQNPPCGTVACLAGSACLMEGFEPVGADFGNHVKDRNGSIYFVGELGAEILGLTEDEAGNLFALNANGWPRNAQSAYMKSTDLIGRAQAAAKAIDALIKSGQKKRTR
jgi:hypothetical protein